MIFLGLHTRLLWGITCIILSCGILTVNDNVVSIEAEDEVVVAETQTIEEIEIEEEIEEKNEFINPVDGGCITSYYGMRHGKLHTGIDIAKYSGADIYASKSGNVTFSGYNGSYGNLIILDNGNGIETYYAHCKSLLVSVGEYVEQGQVIAKMGMTGNATGPHVHFEIRENGNIINPYEYIY